MVEKVTGIAQPVCITIWEPVCGVDNKTYTNKCWAEEAGIEIATDGVCQDSIVPNADTGQGSQEGQAGHGSQPDNPNSKK